MPATVTVACKLPHGLHLDLFEPYEVQVPLAGGSRTETQYRRKPNRVTIHGNAVPHGQQAEHQIVGGSLTVPGYALTHNVPADHWAAWLAANKDSDMVRNRLIFAYEAPSKAEGEARERGRERTGLERLDPDALPRGIQRAA